MLDLGTKRMKLPVRSSACDHVTCFDAHNFFDQFSTCLKHPKPNCPVCNERIKFRSIKVDSVFLQALKK